MIEVAIVAMEEAILADGSEVPAGSLDLERDPMPLPGETAAGVRAAAEPPRPGREPAADRERRRGRRRRHRPCPRTRRPG